jgi:hypothetical protein
MAPTDEPTSLRPALIVEMKLALRVEVRLRRWHQETPTTGWPGLGMDSGTSKSKGKHSIMNAAFVFNICLVPVAQGRTS